MLLLTREHVALGVIRFCELPNIGSMLAKANVKYINVCKKQPNSSCKHTDVLSHCKLNTAIYRPIQLKMAATLH